MKARLKPYDLDVWQYDPTDDMPFWIAQLISSHELCTDGEFMFTVEQVGPLAIHHQINRGDWIIHFEGNCTCVSPEDFIKNYDLVAPEKAKII